MQQGPSPSAIAFALLFCLAIAGCARPPLVAAPKASLAISRLPPVTEPDPMSPYAPPPPGDARLRNGETGSWWRDRPFSGDYQVGMLAGHQPTGGDVSGLFVSKRFGWDFDDRWGLEARVAEGWLNDAPNRGAFWRPTMGATLADADLLFYPWGESRWRPYATIGAGLGNFRYTNERHERTDRILAEVPFGLGVKYPLKDWLVVRAEVLDNLALGTGAMPNYISVTGGVEFRFGDLRNHFWPWSSGSDAPSALR